VIYRVLKIVEGEKVFGALKKSDTFASLQGAEKSAQIWVKEASGRTAIVVAERSAFWSDVEVHRAGPVPESEQ